MKINAHQCIGPLKYWAICILGDLGAALGWSCYRNGSVWADLRTERDDSRPHESGSRLLWFAVFLALAEFRHRTAMEYITPVAGAPFSLQRKGEFFS
jgi:hypothetical protein